MIVFEKNKKTRKYQVGGTLDEDVETPGTEENPEGGEEMASEPTGGTEETPQGQQDPVLMIAQMAAQALQNQDCQAAMQVCQAFLQLVQQMSQQGGAPQEETGEPVYRKGGVLVRRIRK